MAVPAKALEISRAHKEIKVVEIMEEHSSFPKQGNPNIDPSIL